MAKVKFKDLSKKDKIFKIVNLSLMCVLIAITLAFTIYFWVKGDPKHRVPAGFTIMVALFAPYLFELIFRTRVPNILFLGIEIYLVFAGIWGSLLSGYNTFAWLDIVVHTIMGYLVAMLGVFIISRVTDYKKITPWAVALFCLFFSLGVELIWELGEWFADNFIGQVAQGPKIPEYGVPLVTDTMEDILCNFSGAVVFFVQFLIGKFTKCSLGVKTIENELAKGVKDTLVVSNIEKQEELKQKKNQKEENVKKED